MGCLSETPGVYVIARRSIASLDKRFDITLTCIISSGLARFTEPALLHVNEFLISSHLGGPARFSELARLTGLM